MVVVRASVAEAVVLESAAEVESDDGLGSVRDVDGRPSGLRLRDGSVEIVMYGDGLLYRPWKDCFAYFRSLFFERSAGDSRRSWGRGTRSGRLWPSIP